jgi:opacity protein-like surface antigen
MKKRIIIKLAVLAAVAALAFTLASCGGGLSGTYVSTGNAFDSAQFNNEPLVSIEFESFGGAEIVTSGWSTTTYVDGSYKVDGSRITLKAEWDYTGKWEGSYSFSQSGNSIYIDGHEYRK